MSASQSKEMPMGTRVLALAVALVLAAADRVPAAQAPQDPPQAADADEADLRFEQQVVVSASRTEQEIVNAPATISVITDATIRQSPATNMGDLLRAVPGINVAQLSARDVNLTTRTATSTLATSQLALVDGRSIYLDFYGMVMWDLVPANLHEVQRIEVIRGPASAVWGANAMSGVVNVITKSPRQLAAEGGSSLVIGAGGMDRNTRNSRLGTGGLFYVSGSYAAAVDDRWAYKLSAGYAGQSPLARPTGTIPNDFNTPYPPYVNQGTAQPKFDARIDRDLAGGARLTFAGGVAGTEGIIHSGIGPFDVDRGSRLSYVTTRYERGGRRVAFFTNLLNGDATNLLARGPTGQFLPLRFETQTFDIEAAETRVIGRRHLLAGGGNLRHNRFDTSLTPDGDNRTEGGVYLQDEIFISDHLRWVVGGRLDKFSSIDGAVFSPRTTLLVKPSARQTIRLSFNRAFRAPSLINNHIDATILNQVDLSALSPQLAQYVFPIRAVGNPDLAQETLTAYEIGYTGVVHPRLVLTAAVYWNDTDDAIFFTQAQRYSAAAPPPGWPLPPAVLDMLPAPGLPSTFTYLNLGAVRERGFELGADAAVHRGVGVFANYSYQTDPRVAFDPTEVNFPPNHRANAGFTATRGRLFGNMTVSYTGEAFWQDVLDARFAGTTKAYTMVNGGLGARWLDGRLETSVKTTNLLNREVMQHLFGDIFKRQVVGELRLRPR
jgi:outer membrane receptor protein involved in Fe transport